ncbi:MAG: elongation factor G [Armatimonas sp.]
MEKHLPRDVRNIALAGHAGGGKTSLLEAILHVAGVNERLGRVDDGSATTDFDPDETQRKHSIHLALAPCDWPPSGAQKRELHWVDTPGHPDFFGDFIAALRVVDDVLLVTPAQSSGGLEFGMESTWERAKAAGKAEAVFINKMDRERADFYGAIEALRTRFGNHVVPATLPIGEGENFEGVIDLVTMKAHYGGGKDIREAEIPAELLSKALEWREKLLEVAAEGDDALIEKYLGGEELTEDEIERGIHEDLLSGHIVPVFCGSATKCIGIQPLLTHLALEFESPDEAENTCDPNAPFSALVFKTLADPYVGKLTCFRVKTGRITPDTTVWNTNKQREERLGPLFMLCGKRQIPVKELVAGDLGSVAKLGSTETSDTLCDKNHPVQYPPIPFPTPTYAVAASPKTKQDEDKLGLALARVAEEDPAFRHERHPETGETLLLGRGETHLDLIAGRLARFGSKVETRLPKIPYRETLTRSARAQGRHEKQTGGRGQFGDCWLKVEPQTTGTGFVFIDKIVGGAIPRQWLRRSRKAYTSLWGAVCWQASPWWM